VKKHILFVIISALCGVVFLAPERSKADALSVEPTHHDPMKDYTKPEDDGVCPKGMTHVSGMYCTKVKQECIVWKDVPCEVKYSKGCRQEAYARCQTYKPSVCIGERVHKDFCMDTTEHTAPGETLPMNHISWNIGTRLCKEEGQRLCKETEFNFACEGEDMLPYTTGLERPDGICNIDIPPEKLGPVENRTDYRKSAAETQECRSPFGILNMNGNLDEVVDRENSPGPYKDLLKSGHWMPIRARCRPYTSAHNENFGAVYTGFRCCADTSK
jgi:formylglycine-generating enzyme